MYKGRGPVVFPERNKNSEYGTFCADNRAISFWPLLEVLLQRTSGDTLKIESLVKIFQGPEQKKKKHPGRAISTGPPYKVRQ